jgi:hypothetical protein
MKLMRVVEFISDAAKVIAVAIIMFLTIPIMIPGWWKYRGEL